MIAPNYDDYDSLFDTLTSHPQIEDDIKRKLYFMQSDQELISEVKAKYLQSEEFLQNRLSKVEQENRDLKEKLSKREIEIEIMMRQLREALNVRMEISVENQRLKNEIEKSLFDHSSQRSQTMPDEVQSTNSSQITTPRGGIVSAGKIVGAISSLLSSKKETP